MSTSDSSSHRDLHEALDKLHRCLSDQNCIIPYQNRIKLTYSFHELKRHLHSSVSSPNILESTVPIITTTETQSESLQNKINKLLNSLNFSSDSESAIDSTPRNHDLQSDQLKQTLDCFFLFKESAIIKKKDLIYWWVGQGLIEPVDAVDVQEIAELKLKQLIQEGAIEQISNSKYKSMRFSNLENNRKVGLLKKEGTKLVVIDPNNASIDEKSQGSIDTLFNPGVSILNLRRDWLGKMKNLKVLHLGRWSSDPMEHIEIERVEYLESLKFLKQVRFISFKGISRIMELCTEICNLTNLRVLDLQACPNLEVLPKRIGMLKNLTHLDVSECYLLDRIPKGITSLTKLQVLEGFVISDVKSSSSCKFKDLANHLGSNLRKLSIRTRKVDFPANEDDLKAFAKFGKLKKLKIVWIKLSVHSDEIEETDLTKTSKIEFTSRSLVSKITSQIMREETSIGLPEKLEKLEVHAMPQMAVQSLLFDASVKLKHLKKLYIIGGDIDDLDDDGKIEWKVVETMRLKYLSKLYMNWIKFRASFPNISDLEVTRCPHLSFFPCDYNGIWKDVDANP
ncbi:unnamed protein product [Amaranthus hypochondriacus]